MIVRKGYIERIWRVEYEQNMFKTYVLIAGTEPEMQEYLESEFGYVGAYFALNDAEVDMCKKMHMKIYIAPMLSKNVEE